MTSNEPTPRALPPQPDDDETGDLVARARPPRGISIGGDYVGGNQTITQTAGGDIVGRDKITTTTGSPDASQQLAEHFARIERLIAARQPDPNVEKDEIKQTIQRIQTEAQKGDEASTAKLERWLMNLGAMADDIFQVTVATLANPVLGLAKTVQLIAQRAKAEKEKRDAQQSPG
jgi:hypothetical protein